MPLTTTLHSALYPSKEAVIVVLPILTAVTFPLSTVATWVLELDHLISSRGVASEGTMLAAKVSKPSADNSSDVLFRLIPLTGLSTVTEQEADLPPALAVIVADPFPTAVILPPSTVAIDSFEELHSIGSFNDASAGEIVAVSVSVSPIYSSMFSLFSDKPERGARTTTLISTDLSPAFAVMVASPFFTALTLPDSTEAMDLSDELHVTVLSVALSGRTVAVNISSSPSYSVNSVLFSLTSETAIYPFETDTVHSPFFPSAVAVIVAVPSLSAVTRPEALTEAMDDLELYQVTSLLVAVEGETDALSCNVSSMVRDAVVGLTDTDSTRTSCSFWVHAKSSGRAMKRIIVSLLMVLW